MGEVVPFRRPRASEKHRGKTLCKRGYHQWEVSKDRPFDVRDGKLVSVYRCTRCGATKVEAR